MKSISSIKSIKTDSPKTPGGISKSLLTPCRRLGLSRNYKKAGPVPFVSPLSGSSSPQVQVKQEEKKAKKRKKSEELDDNEETSKCTPETPYVEGVLDVDESDAPKPTASENEDLSNTPVRYIDVLRKKRSKILISSVSNYSEENQQPTDKQKENLCSSSTEKPVELKTKDIESESVNKDSDTCIAAIGKNTPNENSLKCHEDKNIQQEHLVDNVTPLIKAKTKSNKSKKLSKTSPRNNSKKKESIKDAKACDSEMENQENITYSVKPRSPNELTKECIVVIQKKIFKTNKKTENDVNKTIIHEVHDSDSDDTPLCQLNKDNKTISKDTTGNVLGKEDATEIKKHNVNKAKENLDDEEDFIDTKKKNVKSLKDKATSISGLKNKTKINKIKASTAKPLKVSNVSDFDDDDDFELDNKKTILIRKSYEKISKPQKVKTTGSITQQDIDELKARIEAKKKLLLARAMTEDTEELRSLIKRWQKGCQDALMELMELMKNKFPDKQNMDYSQMLSMLKIPIELVGYDEENDCFNTPEESNIILSSFKP